MTRVRLLTTGPEKVKDLWYIHDTQVKQKQTLKCAPQKYHRR